MRARAIVCATVAVVGAVTLLAAQAPDRPPLLFREDWTEAPAALPITPAHVANAELVLALHGPGGARVKKSHHDQPADDPYYVWSGETDAPWAVTLRDKRGDIDLTGLAKVRWRARQSGFRRLHVVLRLPGDTWIVSEQSDGESGDWRLCEFNVGDLRWRRLDAATIVEGRPEEAPALSRVIEIGFTDLMRGGGTPASSRLDWIEVYGRRASTM
jgi:hypothetical protein